MREFPTNLADELRQHFASELIDPSGRRFPVTQEWDVWQVEFEPPNQREMIAVRLRSRVDAARALLVNIRAEEFEQPTDVPNESKMSDLAFTISILIEEDVFSRIPGTLPGDVVELLPGPPEASGRRDRQ